MKSSLLFAAIVAVSITSCQSTDEPVTNQPLPQKNAVYWRTCKNLCLAKYL